MLVKLYGDAYGNEQERRYSPAECCGTITGDSVRHARRETHFHQPRNGFSKKIENHEHAIAIHYMYYNFGRIHKTLRVTPTMEAGVSDRVWSLEEIAKLAD